MKKKYRLLFVFWVLAIQFPFYMLGQSGGGETLESGMNEVNSRVRTIGSMACGLIGAIIGLIALGRAAWKFANGEQGAVMSLLEGILAIVFAQIAASFFGR